MNSEMFYPEAADSLVKLMAWARHNPALKKARELSMGENGVLLYLISRAENVTAGELARVLGIGSGGVANLLSSLEKKGYITRSMNPEDRRGVFVAITDNGRNVILTHCGILQTKLKKVLKELGEEDTRELIRICERIKKITLDTESVQKEGK